VNRIDLPRDHSNETVRVEQFRSALQSRIIGRAGLSAARSYRAIYLERGHADLISDVEDQVLSGPLIAWLPWSEEARLRLSAGSLGTHLLLGPQTLSQALRHTPEAAQLAYMTDHPVLLSLTDRAETGEIIRACFRGILDETSVPRPMSGSVIAAFLGILLIHLFRSQPAQGEGKVPTGAQPLANRFVMLVETHFRDHWRVNDYAKQLGISRDRLIDINLRAHGRPPGALIRTRLMQEAEQLLESSTLSVDQVARFLGFSSSPQFIRFFRSQKGMPPGRYRASIGQIESSPPNTSAPYAWP